MAFTLNAAQNVLKGFLGLRSQSILPTCWIALGTIQNEGTENEYFEEVSKLSYTSYQRTQIGNGSTGVMTFTENEAEATNANTIFFEENAGTEVTVNAFGLYVGKETPDVLIYGRLQSDGQPTTVTIGTDNVPLFRINNFKLTLS